MKFFLLCPVPENQKPINDYLTLKEEIFSSFLFNEKKNFFSIYLNKKIIIFFIVSLFFNFSNQSYLFLEAFPFLNFFVFFTILKSFLKSIFFTNIFLLIYITIFYLRWVQLETRLNESRLFYEEGSWYDGQRWEKPFLLIKNDRLLTTQKIKPLFQVFLFFFRGLFNFQLILLSVFFF